MEAGADFTIEDGEPELQGKWFELNVYYVVTLTYCRQTRAL